MDPEPIIGRPVDDSQLTISARALPGCGGVRGCVGAGGGGAGSGDSAVRNGGGSTGSSAAQADIERAMASDGTIPPTVRAPHIPRTLERGARAGNPLAFRV